MNAQPGATVGLIAAVSAGAVHDAPDRRGTAHLVEHLVLRRCRDEQAPWSVNGLTSGRVTMFECVTAAEHRSAAESALMQALQKPLDVNDDEVAAELAVVEIESRSDRTSSAVLGPMTERRKITPSDVHTFHERHYRARPPHLVAVVANDVPPHSTPHGGLTFPEVGADTVHVRERHAFTQVVVATEGCDAAGTALLLDLARRVDPQLPRHLTLPVVPGHRRTRPSSTGIPLTVSVRVTVEPSLTAVAVGIAGAENVAHRRQWLSQQLRSATTAPVYRFADPLLEARWQAFWDLSVTGGWAALDVALTSSAAAGSRTAETVASAIQRCEVTADV
jgi:hypothetical protein